MSLSSRSRWRLVVAALCAGCLTLGAQEFQLRPIDSAELPLVVDSNTAVSWHGGQLRLYTSTGAPLMTTFGEVAIQEEVQIDDSSHFPMWIESVWSSPDGRVYAWYHYERVGVCPSSDLHSPEIGALVSSDGGKSFRDLGIVLRSGDGNDCDAMNGYFAGGHGDFSVIRSRDDRYFYFLFGNYGGPLSSQGVAIARMAVEDLGEPAGAVWKYYDGGWTEPGLGGKVTPIFPAKVAWASAEADSFWGPSVHWNTYLEKYVVVMNRSCCAPGWPQEGIYLSTNADLERPQGWSSPARIVQGGDWYPWVWAAGPGDTSSEAGKSVRLWVRNYSEWAIDFQRDDEPRSPAPDIP